ncbi:uncharacterized protein SAPINGB_P003578 [Magnusiomyces paraingens]|uniref:Fatty acid hydroxylase domain-containing protein n=1 Tax=Magnusiomyces paraingens TaxID=2606893 RepID=A0A5E8BVG3_9ASCO|nr:uncharacterized protein SAPINGB_P003578 [Saprochaete ingens]VVT53447.1 unnamed protein product [Saprochaete ingens]
MDLILEVVDSFVFDKVYANIFPNTIQLPPFLQTLLQVKSVAPAVVDNSIIDTVWANASSSALLQTHTLATLFQESSPEIYGKAPFLMEASQYVSQSLFLRDNVFRQILSMTTIISVFGFILYFFTALLAYVTVFDKETFNHPKYLKNQIYMEVYQAVSAIPVMSFLTALFFALELHGYSKLYFRTSDYPFWYLILQFPLFIFFTDFGVYIAHRGLHHPLFYKRFHKPHHKWIVSTPFASHAFHPIDGFVQSVPYHLFPFIFPLHKISYLLLFVFVNMWTVMIHDGYFIMNNIFVNGTACHTIHHLYFNYNYGQYTTLWDRVGNSYRRPDEELFNDGLKNDRNTWKKQSKKMEEIVKEVEGGDNRVYLHADDDKKAK